MATPQPNNGPRGPERHTHESEQAVDRPLISPVENWPTAAPVTPEPAPAADAPQKVRVKKRRKRSAKKRAQAAAKKTGRIVVSAIAVVALVVVIVLIVRGDLFGI